MVPKENQPKDAVVKAGTQGVVLRCTVTDTRRVTSMEWAATVCTIVLFCIALRIYKESPGPAALLGT